MSFLYDEAPPAQRAGLRSHLEACPECSAQVKAWRGVALDMDRWSLPSRKKVAATATFMRWAAAAAVVVFVTVGGARLFALNHEVKQLRAEVRRNSPGDLNGALAQISEAAVRSANTEAQALVAALAQRFDEQRIADQQATFAALQKLSVRHTEDLAVMRKELETVAVFTETGLQRAQNQLATLTYSPGTLSNNKQD
jgi:hypothetical protein